MTICNDSIENTNTRNLISTDGFVYSPTIQLYQLSKLQAEFAKNATTSATSTVINNFIDIYTEEIFNQGLITFNNFLLSAFTNENLNLAVNYPLVKDRLDKGVAITPIEYVNFMEDVSYNPITIQTAITTLPKNVLKLYDTYINGNFSKSSMGTFCQLAPSIFGAIEGFFTSITNFANKITDIINKIQNFSLSALIDNLKKKILEVVEKSIEKIKGIVENFSIDGLISEVDSFFHDKIVGKFYSLKNEAMKFFNDINIENFKKTIEGLLSYAANIFKDPKIEEIQFLIYRFCSFITQVEDIINSVKNPLDLFTKNYTSVKQQLKTNSSVNTIAAVSAGAKRPTEAEVAAVVPVGLSAEAVRGNTSPPTPEERADLPKWNGNAATGYSDDPRVRFTGNWVNPYKPRCEGGMGEEGWNSDEFPVFEESKVYLMRVHKEFSKRTGINTLLITSAYRSPEYNACLAKRTRGVAKNSDHMKGLAFDVRWAGWPNKLDLFIEIARANGFTGGVGIYRKSSFVHIDRSKRTRQWNG